MKVINRCFIALFIIVNVLNFSGCFFVKADSGDVDTFIPISGQIQTELFFGLSKPDGTIVTEDEWNRFVDDYISPKFNEGFTVVDARGQWTDVDNKIMKEKTKLVIVVYKHSREMDASISFVINNYKRLFQQGSVLKVTSNVAVDE